MTERLYYEDSYLRSFTAVVVALDVSGDLPRVLLDRSAFYPTSGGQPHDTGTLNDVRVTDVNVEDGEVWHTLEHALPVGERVVGEIDWERRFDHMQQHAGDHMIAGAIHRRLKGVTIGLHTGEAVSSIDVAMPGGETHLSPETIRLLEDDVNERIHRDVPIRCWFPSEEALKTLPLRKAPTVSEHVRVVAIGEDEMVACGGTHPSSAGQLGLVKILSATPARGKLRVTFVAGKRAFRDYRACFDAAHAAADALTTSVEQMPGSMRGLSERLHALEREYHTLKRTLLLSTVDERLAAAEVVNDVRLICEIPDAAADHVRDLCSALIRNGRTVALLGIKKDDGLQVVFGRSADVTLSMGELLRTAAKLCGGKGGGRPDFAQGSGPEDLLRHAAHLAKEQLS